MIEMLNELMEDMEEAEENRPSEEEVRFTVDNDQKAEWCLDKIREANDEADRMQAWYTEQMKKILKRRDARVAFFEEKLKPYFGMVPKKATKTQMSYALPSGKLVLKKQAPEFERDDAVLLPWLKENGFDEYVKTKESVDWAGLKKIVEVAGYTDVDGNSGLCACIPDPDAKCMMQANGFKVPGITVTERPDKFVVEVK